MHVAFKRSKTAGKRNLQQNFGAFLFRNSVNQTHLRYVSLGLMENSDDFNLRGLEITQKTALSTYESGAFSSYYSRTSVCDHLP